MTRSDRIQTSGKNDKLVRDVVIDLLLQGPSSFAAMYGFIARMTKQIPNVTRLLNLLKRMENERQIQIVILKPDGSAQRPSELDRVRAEQAYQKWLSSLSRTQLSPAALAVDEVGLWCALTDIGRRTGSKHKDAGWALDVLDQEKIIRIRAETEEEAESVLHDWLARDPTLELIPSTRLVSMGEDSMIELTWRFRRK
jgi:hypothetical protein